MDDKFAALGAVPMTDQQSGGGDPFAALGAVPIGGETTTTPATIPNAGGGGDLLDKTGNVLGAVFPGTKTIGNTIGTLAGYGVVKGKEALGMVPKGTANQYDLSSATPLQNLGAGAEMVLQGAMGGTPEGIPFLSAAEPIGSALFRAAPGASTLARVGLGLGRIGVQGALGFGIGAGGALESGKTDWKSIAQNGELGALWSGGLATAGELGSALVDSMANKTGVSQLTGKKDDLVTLKNSFNDTSTATTNPIKTLDENGLIKDLKVIDGKIDVGNLTNQSQSGTLDNLLQQQKEMGSRAVKSMTGTVDTVTFKQQVIDSIKNNERTQALGDVSKTIAIVNRKFDDYAQSYGDMMSYKNVDAVRVAMNTKWDPETWDAEKAIGTAARGLLYNGSGAGTTLQSAMKNEQELINAKEFLETLNTKAVKGGRLGKYIADAAAGVVGSIAGAPLGPIGSGVGAMASGYAADKFMSAAQSSYFNPISGRVGQGLKNVFLTPGTQQLEGYGKASILGNILGNKGKP